MRDDLCVFDSGRVTMRRFILISILALAFATGCENTITNPGTSPIAGSGGFSFPLSSRS